MRAAVKSRALPCGKAYGAAKDDRLKALKHKYDWNNFFRLDQNIPPD